MTLSALFLRLRWLHAPATLLVMLLQRTPVLRLLTTEGPGFTLRSGELLKSAFALAAFGAYDTVAGATVFNGTVVAPTTVTPASGAAFSTFTATGAVNTAFSVAFTATGAPGTTKSWKVLGTFPAGLSVTGGTAITGGYLFNGITKVIIAGTPTAGGSRTLTVTGYDTTGGTGNNASVTCVININAPPAFTTHPASQTVNSGTNVTFTTVATGTPTPTFQWFKGTTALSGQTSATLSLTGVTAADAGDYKVVATNAAAPSGVASNVATLSITSPNIAPAFTTHPASQTVNSGTNVTFTTVATGTPTPTFQWFKGTTALSGQTSATLSLTGVTAADAGDYKVVATNAAAPSGVASNVATLVVQTAPAFTSAATTQFQALQTGQTFTVTATGLPVPTFSATGLPAWATLNSTTGVLSGTPATAQAGSSTITLTASNGVAPAATQSFLLVVKTALRLWQEAGFTTPELANSAVSGNAAVIAPDGLSNLVHYALGYGPRQTVPASALSFSAAGATWKLAYTRPAVRLGIAYSVESSADLATWTTTGVTHQLVSSAAGIDTWSGTVPSGPARVFLRLKIAEQ